MYEPGRSGDPADRNIAAVSPLDSNALGTEDAPVPPAQTEPDGAVPASGRSASPRRLPPDAWALGAIVLAVVVANLPYLLGFFDPDPLHARAGLASSLTPGVLGGKPTIDPNNGLSSQAIGHLAAVDLLHLRAPWWNPYEGTGMPLLGETQSAALFPPTLLTALANGQLLERMLLELVAGVCTYLLLRRLSITRWAAAAGGIAFALNGTFAWFAHAAINPVAFLPMLLLGIERAFAAAREGRPGGWRLLALAGALSIYAGFPEVAYIDALMGLAWLGWRCGCLPRAQLRTLLTKGALAALTAALLAVPVLLTMQGFLSHADIGVHTSSRLGTEHLGGHALAQLLMPYVYGQINADPRATIWVMVGGYASILPVMFAALGAFARGRRGLRLVLLGFGLLVFARMYGVPPLLGHVIGVLPAMARIQFFRYATPTLELTVIVLAALGLDDLARVPEHRRRLLWAALAALAVVVGVAYDARVLVDYFGRQFAHHTYFVVSIVWAVAVVLAAGLVAFIRAPRTRIVLLASLVAIDAVALFVVPELAAPRSVTVDPTPTAYLERHLGDGRFFTLGPIQPNYGSYFGLASLDINDFPPRAYSNYIHAHLDPAVDPGLFTGTGGGFRAGATPTPTGELLHHLAGYRAAGVRYVLTAAGQALPQSPRTFRLVLRTPTTRIYALSGAAPYFSAAGCLIRPDGRQSAQVSCSRPAVLVRRETWFAGWSATVDGRAVPIRRVDGLFQAVPLPAGSHRVQFSFAPPGITWALLAALAGAVLMCVPSLARLRGRRARQAASA